MSIESTHAQYTEAYEGWKMVLDCISGPRAVRKEATTYVPKLDGQSQAEYDKYRKRGIFFNGTSTANQAQTGLLTRKQPEVETEIDQKYLADIDLQGNDIRTYIVDVARAVSSTGRGATVVEWDENENRPYFAFYREVDILDWHTTRRGGVIILDYLKLRERSDEMVDEKSGTSSTEKVRVYDLREGTLKVTEHTIEGGAEEETESREPNHRNAALTFIPVVFHGVTNTKPDVGEIPLEDIATINISHYNTSIDLEHARHIAALPTPYATGIDDDEAEFKLGTDKAWVASDPAAKFGFIEFTGSGLSELTKALEEKEKQMAALGARLLFAESRDAEAFETVQLRSSADTASLSRMASAMTASLSRAIQIAAWWDSTNTEARPGDYSEKNYIIIPQDFITAGLPSDKMTALVSALQLSAISYETFFYNLQKGEVYQEGRTIDEEKQALTEGQPVMPQPPTPPAAKPGSDE